MSPTFCLVLLFLEFVCASVLLGFAVHGVAMTTKAIARAPALTTHQHRMEAFFASNESRQLNYTTSLLGQSAYDARVPFNLQRYATATEYPLEAAKVFLEAYCVGQGQRFCSTFPLVQTILFPGMWHNPNLTAEIARNLSALPATLANVTVTATTTLESFCAHVNITLDNPQWDARTKDVPSFLARLNDPTRKFEKNIVDLCSGCAAVASASTNHAALQTWIHDTCPMTVPTPSGAACMEAIDCSKRSSDPRRSTITDSCFDRTYRNPSYDACFGHTLMSVAQHYDRAVAIASGVVLLCLLLLAARVWVVRRVQKYQDALRRAPVHTPVENA